MSVRLTGLRKRFGDATIVDDVSLEVDEGELFVLLGASGSGKSTILRLVAGLLAPDAGRVELHGRDVTSLPPRERGVGFVFQNYAVFPHMSVGENVEFGMRIRGVDAAARGARRDELLERVELGGLAQRRPNELSGGQLQRVALARALASEPRVLLLDEPFGALDVKIRAQLRRMLAEALHGLRVTTLLVTHDQDEAFELAHRIGVVERGRLLEVGTAEELYARPRTGWTASFVGSGTVMLGRVEGGRAKLGDLSLELPDDVPHEEGGWVRVLVRPEQVSLSGEPPETAACLGRAEIVRRTFAGAVTHLRLRLPRPAGVRQLSPPPPFGEESLLVDVTLASTAPVPDVPWVSLLGWHVLAQPRARLLVPEAGSVAEPFVARLRDALDAAVVAGPPGDDASRSVSYYDYVVVVADGPDDEAVREALRERLEVPVILVPRGVRPSGPVIACTLVGEPGKADVRIAGSLARHLGARVRLVHAWTRGGEPPAWLRSHLARGAATLRTHGADADVVLVHAASPLQGILDEARSGCSAVVVGASPATGHRIALGLLERAATPVVIVPPEAP